MDLLSYKLGQKSSGGGGGGSSLDWEAIGFSSMPQGITDGYNYAKTIQASYDDSKSYGGDYYVTYFPLVDTSARDNFYGMFNNCGSLEAVAPIDLGNAMTCTNMFQDCRALKDIPQLDTSNVTSFMSMFNGCRSLKNVPLLDTSNATSMGFMFGTCNSLTDTSLNNILRMCINATKITSTNKTLQKVGLSSEQATRCQSLSNYQDFLDAGWTTGY